MKAYSAIEIIAMAKRQNVQTKLVKKFRNGQELREYQVMVDGVFITRKIGAFAHEHA